MDISELELELIQTQLAQKSMLRAEVYARALRASQKRERERMYGWACDAPDEWAGRGRVREWKALAWIPQVTRANTNPPHTPRNTREYNKMHFALCKRTLSPAKHVLEDISYQTRPESMRVMPLCLWGV